MRIQNCSFNELDTTRTLEKFAYTKYKPSRQVKLSAFYFNKIKLLNIKKLNT